MYEERDIMEGRLSYFYCEHMYAMTSEGLHDKSDIAAELAYRDAKIEELKRERDEALAYGERLRAVARGLIADCEDAVFNDENVFCVNQDVVSDLEEITEEQPPTALAALKNAHFNDFCDCNVTAAKMRMATGKGFKITGFLTDDGKCCIDGKVQPLASLKAEWQAEVLGDLYDHLQGIALGNGWDTSSDTYHVSEELKSWCKRA